MGARVDDELRIAKIEIVLVGDKKRVFRKSCG